VPFRGYILICLEYTAQKYKNNSDKSNKVFIFNWFKWIYFILWMYFAICWYEYDCNFIA